MATVNRLKIACIRRNITMRQLAKRLGISESFLSLMATGKRPFPESVLNRAASILECEPENLVPDEQAATSDDEGCVTSSVA